MIKYNHFICKDAETVTNELEEYGVIPEQIVSITYKVANGHTYKWEHTSALDIDINGYYVVFYWYEEE